MTAIRYPYLHGFASSAASHKGTSLRPVFAAHGVELELLDVNRPSFGELTYTDALGALDELAAQHPEARLRIMGSSMGGYLSARWTQLNPGRVDRLVLLCPGFALNERWPALLGAQNIDRWRSRGWLPFKDHSGAFVPVHWRFIEDAHAHPPFPEVDCPVLIVHGTHDEVVPIAGSRAYAAGRDHVRLVEVDDDHGLASSVDRIAALSLDFFEITD